MLSSFLWTVLILTLRISDVLSTENEWFKLQPRLAGIELFCFKMDKRQHFAVTFADCLWKCKAIPECMGLVYRECSVCTKACRLLIENPYLTGPYCNWAQSFPTDNTNSYFKASQNPEIPFYRDCKEWHETTNSSNEFQNVPIMAGNSISPAMCYKEEILLLYIHRSGSKTDERFEPIGYGNLEDKNYIFGTNKVRNLTQTIGPYTLSMTFTRSNQQSLTIKYVNYTQNKYDFTYSSYVGDISDACSEDKSGTPFSPYDRTAKLNKKRDLSPPDWCTISSDVNECVMWSGLPWPLSELDGVEARLIK